MKTLIIVLIAIFTTSFARAQESREMSSEAPKKSKAQQIREYAQSCFDQEISLFESTKGRLPSEVEADFIIDACANPKFK